MLITEYNMDEKDIVVVTFVIIRCFCLIVTVQVSWNIFLAIVCFFYGKLNQLNRMKMLEGEVKEVVMMIIYVTGWRVLCFVKQRSWLCEPDFSDWTQL